MCVHALRNDDIVLFIRMMKSKALKLGAGISGSAIHWHATYANDLFAACLHFFSGKNEVTVVPTSGLLPGSSEILDGK